MVHKLGLKWTVLSAFICLSTFDSIGGSLIQKYPFPKTVSSNIVSSGSFSPDESIANFDEDVTKFLPCVKCNTTAHGSRCMQIDNALFLSNCRKSIGQCYTAILDGVVYRGCVGDELFPNIESTGDKSVSIKLCNDNRLCNQDKIVDTCIGCSGKNCDNPTLEMERPCSLELSQGVGCYLKENPKNTYERGCIQDLPQNEREKCQVPGSSYCQSCPDRNCNQKISFDQKCFYCNGTKEKECSEPKDQKIEITCIGYSSTCLVGVDDKGYAHRQCNTNTEGDSLRFPNGFELCYGNLCNKQLYPKDWTKCFQCAGNRSCDHPSADLLPQPCRVNGDLCFIYGKEDGEFQRGCMGDTSEGRRLCQESEDNCYKCNTTECNYLQSFQLKKLNSTEQNSTNGASSNSKSGTFTTIVGTLSSQLYSFFTFK